MNLIRATLFICFILPVYNSVFAQENPSSCKVELFELQGKYTGECKDGLAHGKGEAIGQHHYTGSFKKGVPYGKGNYYYSDSVFYSGSFQDGIKEGKGEMHYAHPPLADSIIKGYWSGDLYRGTRYVTYSFNSSQVFATSDIQPLSENERTVTIEISTTTASPDGSTTHSLSRASGEVLSLTDLLATDGSFTRKKTSSVSGRMSSVTYEIAKFPVKLTGTFSNGRTFELELYKAAGWRVSLFANQ
jgi:hypothetical protein